jgi:hypothetical protein
MGNQDDDDLTLQPMDAPTPYDHQGRRHDFIPAFGGWRRSTTGANSGAGAT